AETWEKKKTLEYSQQPVNTVTLACYCKRVALGHLDLPKYTSIELMFCMAAVISEFLKKSLISERKGVILCIDMALS
ncbi:hypothetical protein EEL49_00510, partial [Muribaculaceae bacterium Isolate-104 (HZI)]